MTTFRELFGDKLGQSVEQYWPYIFLTFSIYLLLYQVGFMKIIYKLTKQAVVMFVMLLCCVVWYVLMSQHVSTLSKIGTATLLSAFGDPSQLVSNTKMMDPLTEILIISGATLFLLGLLYRQLPIDLIPDCIPCIGKYDNFFAQMAAFFGLCVCAIGVYLQLNYAQSPNSTTSILSKGQNYMHSAEDFVKNNDGKKWDEVVVAMNAFIQRSVDIASQSFSIVFEQIKQQMEANADGNASNIPRNEL